MRHSSNLRPFLPTRTIDALQDLNARLVQERQLLRADGAPAEELERNRLAIVQCQWELSRALIERHLEPSAAQAVA
jgi:hypothetical protein